MVLDQKTHSILKTDRMAPKVPKKGKDNSPPSETPKPSPQPEQTPPPSPPRQQQPRQTPQPFQ